MADVYYSPPLVFSQIFNKKEIPRIGIYESITHNLHLILITEHGENRFDPTYGCTIWDEDFENVYSNNAWQEKINRDIKAILTKHEPRLTGVEVTATISEESFPPSSANPAYRVKRRVDVKISARLTLTDEIYVYTQKLYVSPISLDE